MNVLQELRSRFRVALKHFTDDPDAYVGMIKPAQDGKFGDYQANCAMPLAKQRSTNPRQLATEILQHLDVSDLCDPPEVAGAGFINLRIKNDWLLAHGDAVARDPRLGVPDVAPRNIVVDYSGPNVAKPMHVGHLRSTVIGDALCRLFRFLGHRVVGDNHVGDWGTQFGMIIYGYKHFLDRSAFERDTVVELARLYRLVNTLCDYQTIRLELPRMKAEVTTRKQQLEAAAAAPVPTDKGAVDTRKKQVKKLQQQIAESVEQLSSAEAKVSAIELDPQLKAQADAHPNIVQDSRRETSKLHAGDAENRALWQQFVPACLAAIQRIYDRLGVKFDYTLGESYYDPYLAEVVTELQQKEVATLSDGAVCAFIEGFDAPFIVRKTDGASTYATTDLATIRYRVNEFQADTMLYVVDSRQADHFKLLFATAKKWGYDKVDFRHVSFGSVLGKDGRPYKTRSGDTVGLESLLDESVAVARRVIDVSSPDLDEAAKTRVSEIVGLGAIKYADLNKNRESDYMFDMEKMTAVQGDTATYMQYAFARVCSIFGKANATREGVRAEGAPFEFDQPAERQLLLKLLQFPEALDSAAAECRPNFLTQYLFETANAFSTFFDQCHVKDAPTPALRASRLRLCDLTARVLETGLGLLGVQTVERM